MNSANWVETTSRLRQQRRGITAEKAWAGHLDRSLVCRRRVFVCFFHKYVSIAQYLADGLNFHCGRVAVSYCSDCDLITIILIKSDDGFVIPIPILQYYHHHRTLTFSARPAKFFNKGDFQEPPRVCACWQISRRIRAKLSLYPGHQSPRYFLTFSYY